MKGCMSSVSVSLTATQNSFRYQFFKPPGFCRTDFCLQFRECPFNLAAQLNPPLLSLSNSLFLLLKWELFKSGNNVYFQRVRTA